MNTCTFCKREISDDANECPLCGHAIVCKVPAKQNPEIVAAPAQATMPTMKVSTLFCVGIFLLSFGLIFGSMQPLICSLIRLAGAGFYLAGCWKYTKNKGWNGQLGLLLGLTGIGLVVMMSLENKSNQQKQPELPKV